MRKMKNSAHLWIGIIPSTWCTSKLLYCLRQPICDGPHETPRLVDEGIPFISVDSLNDSKFIDFSIVKKYISKQDYWAYKTKANLEKGDILFSKAATIGKTAIVGDDVFMVWSPLAIIKNNPKKIVNNFLYYLLNCEELITTIKLSGSYNTQANVGMREMERAVIPLPAVNEQEKISAFLDSKCAEIDSLAADIQAQIDTLEQYKRSVITEAVTKGLDKNVPMKDSGTPWCPQIPKHWIYTNPKALFTQRFDRAFLGERQLTASQDHGIVYQDDYMEMTGNRVVTVQKDFNILKHVEPGDFVISMRSFQGGLEYSAVRGCISSAYVMLIPNIKLVYPPFYRWFFKSSKYINAIQSTSNLVRDGQAMRYANFVKVPLFIIPIEEQKKIANYLDIHISEIDEIIKEKQEQLAVLADYKKSLIYEYVTGKKEVPNE